MESISSMNNSSLKNRSDHLRRGHLHRSRWINTGHDKRIPESRRHRFHSQKSSLPRRSHGCSDSADLKFRPSSAPFLKQDQSLRHGNSLGFRKPSALRIDRSEQNTRSFSPRDHHEYPNPRSVSSSQRSIANGLDRKQVSTPRTPSIAGEEASSLHRKQASTPRTPSFAGEEASSLYRRQASTPGTPSFAGEEAPSLHRKQASTPRTPSFACEEASSLHRKQASTPRTPSFLIEEPSSLRIPIASTNSADNLCNRKVSAHHASPPLQLVAESDKKISPRQTERAGSRIDSSKDSPKQGRSTTMATTEKDFRRTTSKISPKRLSEPVEDKQREGTKRSDNSSAKDHDGKKTPEPTSSDKNMVDIFIPFLHVTRKARSERKREGVAKAQISEDVSLDGFSAELELAILKRMENESDTAVLEEEEEEEIGKDSVKAETSSKKDCSSDSNERDSEVRSKEFAVQETQLDTDLSVREKWVKEISSMQETTSTHDAASEEIKPRKLSSDELMSSKKYEANDAVSVLSMPGNVPKLPFSEEVPSEMEDGEVEPERGLVDATFSDDTAKMDVDIQAETTHKEEEAFDGYQNAKNSSEKSTFEHNGSDESKKANGGISGNEEALPMQKGDGFVDKNEGVYCDLSQQQNGSDVQIVKDVGECLNNASAKLLIVTETVTPCISISEELTLSLSMKPTGPHVITSNRQLFSQSKVGNGDCSDEKEIIHAEKSLRFPVLHLKEPDDLADCDHRQKKLKTEYLQLTLAPPVVASLDSSGSNAKLQAPLKVGHSLHMDCSNSLSQTASDTFMSSMLETSLEHNPSCSLQRTSYENNNISCGESRSLSGRFGWSTHKSLQKQTGSDKIEIDSATDFSGHKTKHCLIASERPIPLPLISEPNKDSTINAKKMMETQAQAAVRPQDQQGSKSFPATDRPQCQSEDLGHSSTFVKRCNTGGIEVSIEKIGLREISSGPILAMAQKLQQLPDSFLEGLKDLVKELLGNFAKRDEFLLLQRTVRERKDLTEEALLRAHPTQLGILVALKTGMLTFVHKNTRSLTYKALIEIFLQKRCQNIACQQSLPVDGCECTICSRKKGFCHECMCMVCSKFDSDIHTSRWVGCDVCMHWCHTDCGLRMSYIKPTPTVKDGIISSQIQFKCLSCGHDMELFGFVKNVFNKSAQNWDAEALAKELDCVRRIFHGSEDMRGQELYGKAEEMLQKLENNVDANYVRDSMLQFFSEPDGACENMLDSAGAKLNEELFARNERENKAETVLAPIKPKNNWEPKDLYNSVEARKLEAMNFQEKAEEAQKDVVRLHHILSLKRKMFEDDLSLRYAESRLKEAEERRKKQLEALQMLEISQSEYQRMKARIESDMKILMTKMKKQPS